MFKNKTLIKINSITFKIYIIFLIYFLTNFFFSFLNVFLTFNVFKNSLFIIYLKKIIKIYIKISKIMLFILKFNIIVKYTLKFNKLTFIKLKNLYILKKSNNNFF